MVRREMFISVDIEASGPVPGEYSMLSLGACSVFDTSRNFYVEFKPITMKCDPEAIRVAGLSMEKLSETGADPKAGMQRFATWVKDVCEGAKPVFVAFNASFDWMFVDYYFHRFLSHDPFGVSGLDIKAYYMGKFGKKAWADTSKRLMDPRFLGGRHTHHALDDAIEQAEIFKKMYEYTREVDE